MQSVIESLCRCFGAPMNGQDVDLESVAAESLSQRETQVPARPSTPEMKRRTRSLALQDKQWDALFLPDPQQQSSQTRGSSQTSLLPSLQKQQQQQQRPPAAYSMAIEQAQAVAKAKLAANPIRVRHKRKRSSSRDDIFRSKKQETSKEGGTQPNPFSRFLTSHSIIGRSLCFATPIKDSNETESADSNSMVSESNTLNTAEDTITSTLYYETTKLAGLQQKNPPMPLFNNFQVDERDDIHKIVTTHSHSSALHKELYNSSEQQVELEHVELDDDEDDTEEELTPPASPNQRAAASGNNNNNNGNNGIQWHNVEDVPPPMTNSSSESSCQRSRSSGSRRS